MILSGLIWLAKPGPNSDPEIKSFPWNRLKMRLSGYLVIWKEQVGLATALEVVVSRGLAPALPDYPVIYFGHIRWGYAWCFPGKDLRILGICGLNEKSGKFLKH